MTIKLLTRSHALFALAMIGAALSGSAYAFGRNDAPCNGFFDCLFTAVWWAFFR